MTNTNVLLTIDEVLLRTSLSRSGLYRRIEQGTFPMSRKRGGRVVWNGAAVDAWVADQQTAIAAEVQSKVTEYDHGYQAGYQAGNLEASREHAAYFFAMEKAADRVLLLSNALDAVSARGGRRTDAWWSAYIATAARELREISASLPGACAGLQEFDPDADRLAASA